MVSNGVAFRLRSGPRTCSRAKLDVQHSAMPGTPRSVNARARFPHSDHAIQAFQCTYVLVRAPFHLLSVLINELRPKLLRGWGIRLRARETAATTKGASQHRLRTRFCFGPSLPSNELANATRRRAASSSVNFVNLKNVLRVRAEPRARRILRVDGWTPCWVDRLPRPHPCHCLRSWIRENHV